MEGVCNISRMSDKLIVEIGCELDHHSAGRVREAVDRKIFEDYPRELVLDFSRVGFMDSSGIALIIGRAELMRQNGGRTVLRGLGAAQRKLVRLSGLDRSSGVTVE